MPSQREVKRLNKDLVLAIDWAASEYKYVKELQEELAEIRYVHSSFFARRQNVAHFH